MNRSLFEYAIIRFVPKVERQEFVNVGVILYCKDESYLEMKYYLDAAKIAVLAPQIEMEEIAQHLQSFHNICVAASNSGAIGELTAAERFRWLTATRSTMIQSSKVHPGLCLNPEEALEKLFVEMVG
jgi:hypothetical protein